MKKVKKVVQLMILLLLFTAISELVQVKASVGTSSSKLVVDMGVYNGSTFQRVDTGGYYVEVGKTFQVPVIRADRSLLNKKSKLTPTTAPKKSSEKKEEEEEGIDVIGFLILVVLAVAYFKQQKRKRTIEVKVKK